MRADGLHKLTTQLATTYGTIVVEDLNPAGMTRRPKPVADPEPGVFGRPGVAGYGDGWVGGGAMTAWWKALVAGARRRWVVKHADRGLDDHSEKVMPLLDYLEGSAEVVGSFVLVAAVIAWMLWGHHPTGPLAAYVQTLRWTVAAAAAAALVGWVVWIVASVGGRGFDGGDLGPLWEFVAAQTRRLCPYQEGGTGEAGWDMPRFVVAAYRTVGVELPDEPDTQYAYLAGASAAVAVPAGPEAEAKRSALRPGDVLYWGHDPTDPATISEAAIYVDGCLVVRFGRRPLPVPDRYEYGGGGQVTVVRGDTPVLRLGKLWDGWHWAARPATLITTADVQPSAAVAPGGPVRAA